ncbi:MAG: hypothetical protein A3D56_01135 [Candidatus Taylorbacteria bacterium RIFCSPHIGHO2_02_FULL_45_35]|uniref:Hydrolase TatD n=1 Tax=Candidatus Taylorbacteria bacterium RIFCSPHIGHO2_02_FULL_45_35 TaxID=1802311 RepID=A0A1G2MQ25_9BACT|nr:MAG: hypothetical protein A3D56_01135 [Candidatus Taylorbacteria bacterium RIFCSPHIGHO2_02_FULL_45_35]OHA33792.1 MAG: hypothetical protein A3A22_00050 [Candidatus Taylorbacteria bacterium RIFCSPLOWO2_01_FULL_45_34b]
MLENKPQYIDIHSHVNFEAFKEDRDEVVKRALNNKTWMINVGTQIGTSKSAVALAEKYDKGVYAIVGLHPVHTDKSYHDEKELGEGGKEFTSRGETFDSLEYEKLLNHPKVVGLGECGLDYFRLEDDTIEKQKENFEKQIALANKVEKPLMLHIRNNPKDKTHNAYRDAAQMLKVSAKVKGDVHFFAGSWDEAKLFLDLGFNLSFTGVITFARNYDEVIKNTPLERLLSETDCPYAAPVPYRGKRNEPLYVKEVAHMIANIRGEDSGKVKKALVQNALTFFKIAL